MISIWENSTRRFLELQVDPGVDDVDGEYCDAKDEDDMSKAIADEDEPLFDAIAMMICVECCCSIEGACEASCRLVLFVSRCLKCWKVAGFLLFENLEILTSIGLTGYWDHK